MSTPLILELQRMSTKDGPGIRTTVFFKGCPLHCSWCHNPESLSPRAELQWMSSRCIHCYTCLTACPSHLLSQDNDRIKTDRQRCEVCGTCADTCPTDALEMAGKAWTVDALVSELLKDRSYFQSEGGGVTLSGGEPTLYPDFVVSLCEKLHAAGIHVALDTCGFCSKDTLLRILPHVNLVLYDLKEMNPLRHERFTGQKNERILENLELLSETARTRSSPAELWIRTPLIPGATADPENIRSIGQYLASRSFPIFRRWELCNYNPFCIEKYLRLDRPHSLDQIKPLSAAETDSLLDVARTSGVNPDMVFYEY